MGQLSLFLILIISAATYRGCAVEQKLNYQSIDTEIEADPSASYAVGVLDKREVVLKGNRDAKFVGYMRSGAGAAFPIGTVSDNNFADDISVSLVRSIGKKGASAESVITDYKMSSDKVLSLLQATNSNKLLMITLIKWRSDTKPLGAWKVATEMTYDLLLQVFDTGGKLLAENKVEGVEPGLNPSGAGTIKKIQELVNQQYKEKIKTLFGDQAIIKSMKK